MVRSIAVAYFTLVLCILVTRPVLGAETDAAPSETTQIAKKIKRVGQRYGLSFGMMTWPQFTSLKSSDGRTETINVQNVGGILEVDAERRWSYLGAKLNFGLGYSQARTESEGSSITYSYSDAKSMFYLSDLSGVIYLNKMASIGLGVSTLYSSLNIPTPSGTGIQYSFSPESKMKVYLSWEFSWNLVSNWYLSQKILTPLTKDLQSAWLITLRVTN